MKSYLVDANSRDQTQQQINKDTLRDFWFFLKHKSRKHAWDGLNMKDIKISVVRNHMSASQPV